MILHQKSSSDYLNWEDNKLRTLQAAEPCLCVTLEIRGCFKLQPPSDSHLSAHRSVACMAHICDVSVGLSCSSREILRSQKIYLQKSVFFDNLLP